MKLLILSALMLLLGFANGCERDCNMTDERSQWVCEMVNWRCSIKNWMDTARAWWARCLESDSVPLWQDTFVCPSNDTFECCTGTQECFKDAFDCKTCHCTNGTYKYASRLLSLWKSDLAKYKTRQEFYERNKNSCTPRVGAGCNVVTTTASPESTTDIYMSGDGGIV